MAGPGPVVAEAIFVNNEEVPLQAVYYDPVNAARAAAAPTHARAHRPHAGLGRRAGGFRLLSAPPRHSARTSIGRLRPASPSR